MNKVSELTAQWIKSCGISSEEAKAAGLDIESRKRRTARNIETLKTFSKINPAIKQTQYYNLMVKDS